ncbi:eisosome protein SEG2-like isoform X2 [Anneissia japonica]|uniref:eisosome protein SEG2-like isoform X2 n=1 Tax=Anneissia japonica TaxID=1529436 RepID=UPI001425B4A5|nr:eisosome protein SEG2-like isoform X2 [Anneissia japonica]
MTDVLERLCDLEWSMRTYTPSQLSTKSKCFPVIVKITGSSSGYNFYNKFPISQVLYLHSVQEQFRFVAEDGQSNEISLPINTQINLLKVNINKGKAQCEEMHLKKDMTLPQIVKARCRRTNQENSDSDTEEDYIVMNIKQRGVMKYIMGTCISTDGVSTYIECIPVDYSEISFKVALNMSDNQLAKFERRVQDVVLSIIPESEFISYQGNPEIIINAQPNFIEIEKEHAYTPQKASANYLKNYNRQTTKKNNPRVLISPRKEQRIYIPVRLKSQKPNYENTKTSENKNLGPSSSVEEPDYLECIKKGLWNLKKPPPVPTKSGKTTLVSPTSNMRRISEGQNRPSTLPKPTNIIQKPKLLQKPVVIKKPSKTEQIGIVPIDTRPSVPLKTPEKEAPPSLPQRPQLKAPKPSDFRQNQLLGTSIQSLRNYDDDDDDDNDYCNEELPTYRPPCVHNSDNDEEFDDEFDDDFDSDDDKDDDDVESDDDDYDKIEQFIFEVYSRKTDYQSTSKSPIRLPIEESAEYVEVPEKNTKSKGKKNASPFGKRSHFFSMPKPFKNKQQSKHKENASSTLPAQMQSQHKTKQDGKIHGTEDLPDDLSTLTGRQVQDCLRLLKLEKYLEVFEELGVDGSLLVAFDQDMMKKELNFTSIETLKLHKFITEKWLPR